MTKFLSIIVLATLAVTPKVWSKEGVQWSSDLAFDWDQYGAIFQKDQERYEAQWQLRRAKLGMKYDVNSQWRTEIEFKISDHSFSDDKSLEQDMELADANLRWRSTNKAFRVVLGQMKHNMGHERMMSSNQLPVIERSMATSAFTRGRSLGLNIAYYFENQTFSSGIFESKVEEKQIREPNLWVWSSRWTQKYDLQGHPLHLGLGYNYRDLKQSLFQLEESAEVNTADNILRGARFYADDQHTLNVELGWQGLGMWIMSELFYSATKATDGDQFSYSGFYIQLVYSPVDRYKYKQGRFKARKKSNREWEWVVRYTGLDLRDHNLGTEAGSLLLGGRYFITPNMSLMLNHLQPTLSGNVVNEQLTGSATSCRISFQF